MLAHRTEAFVREDGSIIIRDLPFRAGDKIEVLCIETPVIPSEERYPLRGKKPYRFDDPFSPAIPPEEWEAMQ